ncbi:Ig-like domain-containing protein, partial [Pseudorhizobium xiangyangii]|uniref:Ig-like domain-containing protein n=1 Tax=Pseudorhizobium xiangyangii TaxID=2883104 RepID=UPI0028F43820
MRIYDGATYLGETTTLANGTWSLTTGVLLDGLHALTAQATDIAGNASPMSEPWSVTISVLAPNAPVIASLVDDQPAVTGPVGNNGSTNDTTPILNGSADPNVTVNIYVDGVLIGSTTSDTDGKWTFNFAAKLVTLDEGFHSITASGVNSFGFEGSQSLPRFVTVDLTPPVSPIIVSAIDDVAGIINTAMPSGTMTNDTMPSFKGSTDPYAKIKLYDGTTLVGEAVADSVGNWTIQLSAPLANGLHNFTAKATDPAGNEGPASNPFTLTIDAAPPAAPKINKVIDNQADIVGTVLPGGSMNDPQPRIEGTAESNATIMIYDGATLVATVNANAAGNWSYKFTDNLADGVHTFTAIATDLAGNTGPASAPYTVELDTIAPLSPQVVGIEDDRADYTGIMANNALTNDATPKIIGKAEAFSKVDLFMDGVYRTTVTADANGDWSYQYTVSLGAGAHAITAQAVDAVGNRGNLSAEFNFTIDTTAPAAPKIISADDNALPSSGSVSSNGWTNDTTPTLNGTAEANSKVTIYLNGVEIGTTTASTEGVWTFTTPVLGDGSPMFTAEATDVAGNTGPMSSGFLLRVDTVSPDIPAITDVSDDLAGVVGMVANNGLTNDTRPMLSGTAEAGTELQIFGGPSGTTWLTTLTVPGSGLWSWTPTTNWTSGTHKLTVKSTDRAGNEAVSDPWVIVLDANAPSPPVISTIYDDQGPVIGNVANTGWTNDSRPVLSGTAEANSTLTIFDNGVEIAIVTVQPDATWTWTPEADLTEGAHNFTAKATDAAGNTSGSSTSFTINVDVTVPPAPSLTRIQDNVNPVSGDLVDGASTNDPTPTLYGTSEPYATVNIYDNGVLVGTVVTGSATTWNWTPPSNIPEGSHVYTVTQTDRAGYVSPPSEPFTIIVDLLAPLAPTITRVVDDVEFYTGDLADGALTNDSTPTVHGKGVAGSTITVYDNGTARGTTVVDADGNWSLTVSMSGSGNHLLVATATDAAGNASPNSNSWQLSLDTTVPGTIGSSSSLSLLTWVESGGNYTITGKQPVEPGAKVSVYENGVEIASTYADGVTGDWSITLTDPGDAKWHKIEVILSDAAGNYREPWYNYSEVTNAENTGGADSYAFSEYRNDFFIQWSSADTLPAPLIKYAVDDVLAQKGYVYEGGATNDQYLKIFGVAKYSSSPTHKVNVYDGDVLVGSVTVP